MKRINSPEASWSSKRRQWIRTLTTELLETRRLLAVDSAAVLSAASLHRESSQASLRLWCDQIAPLQAAMAGAQGPSGAPFAALEPEGASSLAANSLSAEPIASVSSVGATADSSISGTKWNDVNGNGALDAGEPGLAGWTVYADANLNGRLDPGEQSAVTDSAGRYTLTGLAAGGYTIGEVAQNGWQQTSPGAKTYPILRISLSDVGEQGMKASDEPSISADGRYVAFQSANPFLDGNSDFTDIFVVDRMNNTIEKVNIGLGGAVANSGSYHPAISSDGRFVAFQSYASNLVAGDTNGYSDVFVFDRQARTMTLVSVDSAGNLSNSGSGLGVDISGDGRYVAFQSDASDLVDGDTNNVSDIFVRDLQQSVTRRVSVSSVDVQGNGSSLSPAISDDGAVVAFESGASNLVSGDTNYTTDVFVHILSTGTTRRVSQSSSGTEANNQSHDSAISGNGRYVGFYSYASNLVAGDTNGTSDVFVVDLQSNTVEAASLSSSGTMVGGASRGPSFSFDGRFVAFSSYSSAATLSNVTDVFIRDRVAGTTRLVSRSVAGTAAGGGVDMFALNDDGQTIAFSSDAKNLVPDDLNYARDIFTVDVSFPWAANTRYVAVGASQAMDNIDFGNELLSGDLRGTAWQDTSRNGALNTPEPGIENRTIILDANANGALDPGESSTVTDAAGNYHFGSLAAGTYVIREDVPSSWTETAPSSGSYSAVSGVERSVLIDFEDRQNPTSTYWTIADFVHEGFVFSTSASSVGQWLLYGLQSSPPPPSMELVTSFRSATQYVRRVDSGLFSIDSFDMRLRGSAGPYTVTVVGELSDGQWITQNLSITGTATTYSLTGFTDLRSFRWYSAGTSQYAVDNFRLRTTDWDYSGLNFGSMGNPGKISGTVYYDNNKNGVRDVDDFPLAGRRVYFDLDNDGELGTYEPQAISDANGAYQFDAVDPGNYVLRQVQLTNWHQTQPAAAYAITLAPEQNLVGQDFGNWGDPTAVFGSKYNDVNANGTRDVGEPGLAGWTMYLDLNENGLLDSGEPSTVTAADDPATAGVDESGSYGFENVSPGTYSVREVPQAGWRQTSPVTMTSQIERSSPTGFDYTGFTHTPPVAQAVSGNGRYLAFSTALRLLPADTNSRTDIYWLDRQTDALELISVTSANVPANDTSFEPVISDDGRYVAFRSWASDLVAGDTNQNGDIFVRDRITGSTQLATIAGASQANSYSYGETLTGDGRTVLFWSNANNLVPNDTNQSIDTFLKNLDTGAITRVNTNTAPPDIGNENTYGGDITADGRYIAFQSFSNDIVAGDTNGYSDIFVLDRSSGQIELVSTSSAGTQGNGVSEKRAISDDGRFVVFDSNATNLTDDLGANGYNIYMKDLATGETRLISRNYNGGAANGSRRPDISADGRWIVFESTSQTMFPDSANSYSAIILYDRLTDTLTRLSQNPDGTKAIGGSILGMLSRDGSAITFMTEATTIAPDGSGLLTITRTPDFSQPLPARVTLSAGVAVSAIDFGGELLDKSAPTDILLSSSHLLEKLPSGSLVGQLSAVDASQGDEHRFALVAGAGDADNAAFQIVDDQLRSSQSFEFSVRKTFSIRVRTTDASGNALERTFPISIDNVPELATAAQFGDGTAQRSSVNQIMLEFDGAVDIDAGAIQLHKRELDSQGNVVLQLVDTSWQTNLLPSGHMRVTLSFSGAYVRPNVLGQLPNALVDGNYQLTMIANKIRASGSSTAFDGDGDGAGGGDYVRGAGAVDDFFAYYGDANGDRVLDLIDYTAFRNAYGKSIGTDEYRRELDYNDDGQSDLVEYTQFRNRYGNTLSFQ
ncbi:MAG: SdrD B-like domain-containing protein [Aureliella sp.]